MFEHIHFNIYPGDDMSQYQTAPLTRAMEAAAVINPTGSSDYSLDGIYRALSPFPVSDEIQAHGCWLQSFGWAHSQSGYFTKRSNAASYLLSMTYSGEGILEYHGSRRVLHPGEGFFINCREYHEYRTHRAEWEHVDVHMAGPLLDLIYEEYQKNGRPVFSEPVNGILHQYLEQLAIHCDNPAPYRDIQVSSILYRLAAYLLGRSAPMVQSENTLTQNLMYLVRYIDNHYAEKLPLDALARISGISKYYLSREFHRYTGFPPNEYIIRQRIGQAQILLSNTQDPVSQIAEKVGIPNVQHFSRQFHRVVGVSPREYRNRMKV